MATKKKIEEVIEETVEEVVEAKMTEEEYWNEMVEIPPLFYDKEKYSAAATVCVNGKMYLIPRGKAGIKVPRIVKEVLDQSEYQTQYAGRFMDAIEGVKNMGEF